MSTLKATNLSHASAASPNIVLDSAGKTTFGGAVAGAGMDLITPTSVAGTGVTVSGGAVSFSASTSLSVNGCFTSTYQNYFILMNFAAAAATPSVSWRYRAAGTDYSGATYSNQRGQDNGSVAQPNKTQTQTSNEMGDINTVRTHAVIHVFGPQDATQTTLNIRRGYGDILQVTYYNLETTSTSYDGFSIIMSSSNFTGTLRVYGYRNS